MKHKNGYLLALLGCFFLLTGFKPVVTRTHTHTHTHTHTAIEADKGSLLYIDGRNVIQEGTVTLRRDKPFSLEAYDLAPGSQVHFKATKVKKKIFAKSYTVNKHGFVRELIFIPKETKRFTCKVAYVTDQGIAREIVFKVDPI